MDHQNVTFDEAAATTGTFRFSSVSSSRPATLQLGDSGIGAQRAEEFALAVENAVYAHIRALRAIGKTTVNTAKIADSLDIPRSYVDAAVRNLTSRRVRIIE